MQNHHTHTTFTILVWGSILIWWFFNNVCVYPQHVIVATWHLIYTKRMRVFFCNGTDVLKGKHNNELITMMVCTITKKTYCLSKVIYHSHNWLFGYIPATTKHPFFIMVAVFYLVTFSKSLTHMYFINGINFGTR